MTDESIINLSDETKSSLRIYATMAGFFVIFATMLYSMATINSGEREASDMVKMFSSVLLIIIGTTLALLHKRDLFAAFFILFAFMELFFLATAPRGISLVVGVMFIIAALAFLQNHNEQRCIVAGLLIIDALAEVCKFAGLGMDLVIVFRAFMVVACLYFAIVLACERFKLPLRDYLVADESVPEKDGQPVHFKEMGSSIGFLILSMMTLFEALYRFGIFGIESFDGMASAIGIILIVTGIIMMVAGRMRGTPFYFIIIGFLMFMMASGYTCVEFVCIMVLGVMMMLRADSRILFGLGLVLVGASSTLGFVGVPLEVRGAMSIIEFLIFTYLVFAVNSNGKLKLV